MESSKAQKGVSKGKGRVDYSRQRLTKRKLWTQTSARDCWWLEHRDRRRPSPEDFVEESKGLGFIPQGHRKGFDQGHIWLDFPVPDVWFSRKLVNKKCFINCKMGLKKLNWHHRIKYINTEKDHCPLLILPTPTRTTHMSSYEHKFQPSPLIPSEPLGMRWKSWRAGNLNGFVTRGRTEWWWRSARAHLIWLNALQIYWAQFLFLTHWKC